MACLAVRGGDPRRGQLRVFRDPTLPSQWLVKRVGSVRGAGRNAIFEARSDNPRAPGVIDSRQFGWVPAAGSYRVLWTVRGPTQPRPLICVSRLHRGRNLRILN